VQLNSPDADYAHLQQGIILVIQRKYSEAGNEFDRVATYPGSRYAEDALFQRAQLDFEQSNYAPAVMRYSQLINSSKSFRLVPYALTRRAASYYNLKKFDQTANDYITVLDKYPAHPAAQDLLLPLQEALNLSNRSGEFERYLSQFKVANPDAKGIEVVEFETAKNLYFSQNYAGAIDHLSRYVAGYPESPRLSEAKYYQAESYYRLRDFPKALEFYKSVTADAAFTLLGKSVARVAELEFKGGRFEQAVTAFQRLNTLAGNKKEENTAWNGLMESYYLLAKYDSADIFARKLVEQGNINIGSQNKASLFLGKSAMARGDYETAKDEFLSTLNSARDEYGAEAKYSLAEIFYLNHEYKQSNETLIALNTDFVSYTDWVGKSFLLIADNYLANGEVFQSKATLKSLIANFPKQDVKDKAAEKLKAIEKDELLKKEKVDSTGNER
jgi:TolA-binding protein